jgi:excisionase family DNA binding protein
MDDKHFISIRDASKITGIGLATLRKMADDQTIRSYKTFSGQRKFHKESLEQMCSENSSGQQIIDTSTKQNFIYARVSSKKQLDDLQRQITFLQIGRPEFASYTVISDIASGINFQRKGLLTILDSCIQGTVGNVVIAHRDRLCRFGYELIEQLITRSGGTITVMDKTNRVSTSEEELASDLLSIVHIYSCRQMGKRKYSRKPSNEVHQDETEIDKTTDTQN